MPEQKTRPTKVKVSDFIAKVPDERRRAEAKQLLKVFKAATGMRPKMWGPSIVGYGFYHYKYASGHEGYCCLTGFSPRKAAISIYIMADSDKLAPLFKKLGPHKRAVGCLYLKRLEGVDLKVLERLIRQSVDGVRRRDTTLAAS